jgi:hypothetical protein
VNVRGYDPAPAVSVLSVPCPTCNASAGRQCKAVTGGTLALSKQHLSRRLAAEAASTPREATDGSAVGASPPSRFVGKNRKHASACYRVVATERTKGGGMRVAVRVDDVIGGRLVAFQLGPAECSEWGPDEKRLRSLVEQEVNRG